MENLPSTCSHRHGNLHSGMKVRLKSGEIVKLNVFDYITYQWSVIDTETYTYQWSVRLSEIVGEV